MTVREFLEYGTLLVGRAPVGIGAAYVEREGTLAIETAVRTAVVLANVYAAFDSGLPGKHLVPVVQDGLRHAARASWCAGTRSSRVAALYLRWLARELEPLDLRR